MPPPLQPPAPPPPPRQGSPASLASFTAGEARPVEAQVGALWREAWQTTGGGLRGRPASGQPELTKVTWLWRTQLFGGKTLRSCPVLSSHPWGGGGGLLQLTLLQQVPTWGCTCELPSCRPTWGGGRPGEQGHTQPHPMGLFTERPAQAVLPGPAVPSPTQLPAPTLSLDAWPCSVLSQGTRPQQTAGMPRTRPWTLGSACDPVLLGQAFPLWQERGEP